MGYQDRGNVYFGMEIWSLVGRSKSWGKDLVVFCIQSCLS